MKWITAPTRKLSRTVLVAGALLCAIALNGCGSDPTPAPAETASIPSPSTASPVPGSPELLDEDMLREVGLQGVLPVGFKGSSSVLGDITVGVPARTLAVMYTGPSPDTSFEARSGVLLTTTETQDPCEVVYQQPGDTVTRIDGGCLVIYAPSDRRLVDASFVTIPQPGLGVVARVSAEASMGDLPLPTVGTVGSNAQSLALSQVDLLRSTEYIK